MWQQVTCKVDRVRTTAVAERPVSRSLVPVPPRPAAQRHNCQTARLMLYHAMGRTLLFKKDTYHLMADHSGGQLECRSCIGVQPRD